MARIVFAALVVLVIVAVVLSRGSGASELAIAQPVDETPETTAVFTEEPVIKADPVVEITDPAGETITAVVVTEKPSDTPTAVELTVEEPAVVESTPVEEPTIVETPEETVFVVPEWMKLARIALFKNTWYGGEKKEVLPGDSKVLIMKKTMGGASFYYHWRSMRIAPGTKVRIHSVSATGATKDTYAIGKFHVKNLYDLLTLHRKYHETDAADISYYFEVLGSIYAKPVDVSIAHEACVTLKKSNGSTFDSARRACVIKPDVPQTSITW